MDLDDEELKATRMMNGADRNSRVNMEQDIKNLQEIVNLCNEELDNEDENVTAVLDLVDLKSLRNLIKAYKELEEELKEEKELNKIIKNTKLDELFTTPRRNGKTIELAMQLREEILKLPECKLYGIKNCKNKVVLLTKEECIPVSLVEEMLEHYKELQNNYIKKYDEVNDGLQAMINVLQELLEKRR